MLLMHWADNKNGLYWVFEVILETSNTSCIAHVFDVFCYCYPALNKSVKQDNISIDIRVHVSVFAQ